MGVHKKLISYLKSVFNSFGVRVKKIEFESLLPQKKAFIKRLFDVADVKTL